MRSSFRRYQLPCEGKLRHAIRSHHPKGAGSHTTFLARGSVIYCLRKWATKRAAPERGDWAGRASGKVSSYRFSLPRALREQDGMTPHLLRRSSFGWRSKTTEKWTASPARPPLSDEDHPPSPRPALAQLQSNRLFAIAAAISARIVCCPASQPVPMGAKDSVQRIAGLQARSVQSARGGRGGWQRRTVRLAVPPDTDLVGLEIAGFRSPVNGALYVFVHRLLPGSLAEAPSCLHHAPQTVGSGGIPGQWGGGGG